MKIMVTGCAGLIGSHLTDALLADGHEVFGIDSLIGGERSNVSMPAKNFLEADCCEFDGSRRYNPFKGMDVVYHCAALAYEGLSPFSPALISGSILHASTCVFSAAIAGGVRRIVNLSSMSRYGEGGEYVGRAFKENFPVEPCDPYGICKVAAEQILEMLCQMHGVEYVIAVPHNVYGERQAIDPYRNVATIFANRMLLGKPPIIYGNGRQKRGFSYVGDAVPSLVKMATQQNVVGEVVNIGPDEEFTSINDLADILAEITGFVQAPIYMPPRPAEVELARCSSDKARRLLDYKTTTKLKDGLVKLVEDIKRRGPREFDYKHAIEIRNKLTPKTWSERLL